MLVGEVLDKWVNGFRLKPYHGPMSRNQFEQPENGTGGVISKRAPTIEPISPCTMDE